VHGQSFSRDELYSASYSTKHTTLLKQKQNKPQTNWKNAKTVETIERDRNVIDITSVP